MVVESNFGMASPMRIDLQKKKEFQKKSDDTYHQNLEVCWKVDLDWSLYPECRTNLFLVALSTAVFTIIFYLSCRVVNKLERHSVWHLQQFSEES